VGHRRLRLRGDPIVDLYESATAPLTPRRVLDNVLGAPARTRLHIPIDPEQAYRRFCGAGVPIEVERARTATGDQDEP
jgi:hypothetical protein